MLRRWTCCSVFALALLLWLAGPFGTAAAYPIGAIPRTETLLTVQTPHYRIIYQEPLADSLPLLARYAEEAFAVLTEIYRWKPRGRIDLFYIDALDTHNGWATVVPHNTILIYAAGAEPGSSIYAPGNDLRRTMYHELAHVLTMDMRFGYNRLFSSVFGKALPFGDPVSGAVSLMSASPVALAPSWYLEGQAIWAETEFAPPGRGESAFVDMLFRTAVRDANLLPHGEWYLEIPHWPYGTGAYIYGARLIEHIDAGTEAAAGGALNEEIARGVLFAASRAARRSAGRDFETLSAETLARETALQRESLSALQALAPTPAPRITPEGMAVSVPLVFGPHVYLLAAAEEETSRLYRYDPPNGEVRRTSSAQTTPRFGALAADRTRGSIIYTRLNILSNENLWYEVRRFDPLSGDDSLVTDRGRYRAVDIAPDGRTMAAVSQRGGKSYLIEADFDEGARVGAERILLELPVESDLSSPRFCPDGSRIAYVAADRDGFRLQLFDTRSGSHTVLFATTAHIVAPAWHPAGQTLVFGSDLNGVFNLYEIDAREGASPAPITHVTGGLFFPAFSDDALTLYAVAYDGFGPHLTRIPYNAERPAGDLPVITTVRAGREGTPRFESLRDEAQRQGLSAAQSLGAPDAYNSFSHIRFDYWSPWLTASTDGVQGGVGASLSDPARFQETTLLAGRESRYGTPVGGVFYTYRGIWPTVRLYAAAQQDFYHNLLRSDATGRRFDHAEEVRRFGAAFEYPVHRLERRITLEGGYEYRDRRFIGEVAQARGAVPLSVEPSPGDEGLLWGRLSLLSAEAYGRSSSLEDGRLVTIGAEWSRRDFGGDLARSRFLAGWNEYLAVPWGRNHVLKLSTIYGFGTGERTAQGLFGLGGFFDPMGLQTPGLASRLPLRGYPSNFRTGERVFKGEAAYRFPIVDISRGREGVFPVYSRQLFAEIFYEAGRTWRGQGGRDDGDWISSTGAEINYSLTILRYVSFAPGIGVAYAPQRAAQTVQPYLSIKGWVNF